MGRASGDARCGPDRVNGLRKRGAHYRPAPAQLPPRIQNAREFALERRVLLLAAPGGAGIDVLLGALPYEEKLVDRATTFAFSPGLEIRTCSAEDLVILKLFALRPLDIGDAESVVVRQRGKLDWSYIEEQLRPLADVKQDPEILGTLARLRQL